MFQKSKFAIQIIGGCAAVGFLAACADMTHFNQSRIGPGEEIRVTYVDAKQRAIIAKVREVETTEKVQQYTKNGKDTQKTTQSVKYKHAVCAEPSPDALSAIAASQGILISKADFEAALNNAVSESASSIGLRTQSIQLMRDSMYRLCEAKLSGTISDASYETLIRRFQSSMVAVLAIEQLTGVVKAAPVILHGGATVGAAEQVAKYTEQSSQQAAQVELAQSTEAEKQEARDKAQTALDEKTKQVRASLKIPDGTTPDAQQTKEIAK